MTTLKVQFSEKTQFLFEPYRYKVMYGGRGSGKSHAAARYLLIAGLQEKHRVLCVREVQKSIKDSVHKLLSDLIDDMDLHSHYEVLETVIRGRNGTEFLFNGLANQTAGSVKSLEGATKVWAEEAQTISKRSWDILIPTIRADNSEFIITFNPELETDDTFRRFVTDPPINCKTVHINYSDNPWFPQVLEQEREHCLAASPEDYDNIWEGQCRPAAAGAIYAKEVSMAMTAGRVCQLPYDPGLKVHVVMDLGFGDNMAVIFVQRLKSEIRIIDYIQERQRRTDEIGAMIKNKLYNLGDVYLPHDGFHTVRGTGLSDKDILQRMGLKVKATPNIPREDGIRNARNQFHRVFFDKVKTAPLLECLKRYRRAETKHGGDGNPVHNEHSDGSDAFRYLCLNIDKMTNEDDYASMPQFESFEPTVRGMGY